jgi:hypothetical protein
MRAHTGAATIFSTSPAIASRRLKGGRADRFRHSRLGVPEQPLWIRKREAACVSRFRVGYGRLGECRLRPPFGLGPPYGLPTVRTEQFAHFSDYNVSFKQTVGTEVVANFGWGGIRPQWDLRPCWTTTQEQKRSARRQGSNDHPDLWHTCIRAGALRNRCHSALDRLVTVPSRCARRNHC